MLIAIYPIQNSAVYNPETHVNDDDVPTIVFRLPNNTRPVLYDLFITTLSPTLDNDTMFTGTVVITLEGVGESSNTITLHRHRSLSIDRVDLRSSASSLITYALVDPPEYEAKSEMLTFMLADNNVRIKAGARFVLTISFTGQMSTNEASGLYRTSYVDAATGERRWLVATQFAPTHARQVFPCYDEPSLRAPMRLEISHGSKYIAISNMERAMPPFGEYVFCKIAVYTYLYSII